ncbi:unnamed protein product [Prunus armeniaca]
MDFIQGVPSPMVDSHNYFFSWRVSFKKASEVNSVVNFNHELVKVFNFQTRDPEFGFTESFKAWWGKISATWFSQPSEVHMERIFWGCACSSTYYSFKQATKEASVDSSHSQGEKRPLPSTQDVGEDCNSPDYDVEIPPANDIILARPRKIPRNPLPPGMIRIVEQPNPTHLTMATHSTVSSSAISTEVIGVNPSTNPDVAEPQQVTQPSGNCEIPQSSPDVSIPILTDQQPEVGEPIMPDLSSVQACIAGALVESGSEQPLSTDQDDLIQSLLDHRDASATTAEASTRHATSSTVVEVLPDPAVEVLLRSYKDRDCISLADQDERDKVKAVIEALVNFGYFPDQTTIRTIMHLFKEVARLIP